MGAVQMHIYASGWEAPDIDDLRRRLSRESVVYHIGHLAEECDEAGAAARYLREIRNLAYKKYRNGIVNLLQERRSQWNNLQTEVLSTRPVYIYYSVPKGENLCRWKGKNALPTMNSNKL